MLSGRTRILDFDGSVSRQERLLQNFSPDIVDLKKLGPSVRLWSNARNAELVRRMLRPEAKEAVTFLGSGDFHHITSLLVGQYKDPLTVISFDHHPDWDVLPPKLGCGSWVTKILGKENVKKVVLLGMSSIDISSPLIQSGNLRALRNDRLEIYPHSHAPTRVFLKKVPENACLEVGRSGFFSEIGWHELNGRDPETVFAEFAKRLPVRDVYVTIDKDCLRASHALTNWEEGLMELDELLKWLALIREKLEIVGLDITGDHSFPRTKGLARAIYERWDHPRCYSARGRSQEEIDSVNEATNLAILQTLFS